MNRTLCSARQTGLWRKVGLWRSLVIVAGCGLGVSCSSRDFSVGPEQTASLGAGLPSDFLLGVATAAHQIEGGIHNNWEDWEQTTFPDGGPHIRGGQRSGLAADSWDLWREDNTAIEYLGANAYRLGIEWARLEPEEGVWDEAAFEHYRVLLEDLRSRGIEPMVTIVHVTLPKWVAAHGGWEWEGIVPALGEVSARLGARYGALVDHWCTVNEPNAIFAASYLAGFFPPGVTDGARGLKVFATLLDAHAAMTKALRQSDTVAARGPGYPATFIGIAHNINYLTPASSTFADVVAASLGEDLMNESVIRAGVTGSIDMVFPPFGEIHRYNPDLKGSFDYIGLNYYHRTAVRVQDIPNVWVATFLPDTGVENWPDFVSGFYETIFRLKKYNLPILITENGASADDEAACLQYFKEHFYAIQLAVRDGADVRGYYYWSLIDNFEWQEGFNWRAGLFKVDFSAPDFKRTPRAPVVDMFRQVSRNMGRSPAEVLP